MIPDLRLEGLLRAHVVPGTFIAGIDEAGVGAWAGPIVVGVVALHETLEYWHQYLRDSKQLTPARRLELAEVIVRRAALWQVRLSSSEEVDALGVATARALAVARAWVELRQLPVVAIVDGRALRKQLTFLPKESLYTDKADQKSCSVAAASILAKVARDAFMGELQHQFPGYNWAGHKGYGTRGHRQELEELGPCEEHRKTFAPIRTLTQNRS